MIPRNFAEMAEAVPIEMVYRPMELSIKFDTVKPGLSIVFIEG